MKLLLIVSLICGGFASVLAQDQTTADKQQIIDQVGEETLMSSVQTYDNRYEGVKGNPFLSDDWQMGSFELTDGSTYEKMPLRYDLLADELHFQNQMKVASVVPQERLKKFTLSGPISNEDLHFSKARYFESLDGEVKPNKLVQLVYDNDFRMVAVRFKVIKKADYEGGYSRNRTYDEITEVAPKYFLLKPGESAERIKPRKKSLLKAFPQQSQQLEGLLDAGQYDLADPNEMARLLNQLR